VWRMTRTGVDNAAGARQRYTFGVVILNWNNAEDTISCLDALAVTNPRPKHVVVVDNGSADRSVVAIGARISRVESLERESFEQSVTLIRADANLGFAGGTNLGLAWLKANTPDTHFVLLNNDATVTRSFFGDMADAIDQIGEDAIIGPTIYEDPDRDRLWYAGAREIPFRALVQHTCSRPDSPLPRTTDFVSGCAMAISRGVIDRIGILAEIFFPAYFEDGDFCHRARRAGIPVMYAPVPVVYHKVGSTVRAANIETLLVYAKNRLRVVYVRRNYTGSQKAMALTYLAVTKPAKFIVETLSGHPRRGWAILSGSSAGFLTRDVGTR
ncbi:MAG: glycosyltransferase family 2 protein, partial [Thermoanaerobaculia bacterium]